MSPFPHLTFYSGPFESIMGFAKTLISFTLLFIGYTLVNGSTPKVKSTFTWTWCMLSTWAACIYNLWDALLAAPNYLHRKKLTFEFALMQHYIVYIGFTPRFRISNQCKPWDTSFSYWKACRLIWDKIHGINHNYGCSFKLGLFKME